MALVAVVDSSEQNMSSDLWSTLSAASLQFCDQKCLERVIFSCLFLIEQINFMLQCSKNKCVTNNPKSFQLLLKGFLILKHTIPTFSNPEEGGFRKHLEKRRKYW